MEIQKNIAAVMRAFKEERGKTMTEFSDYLEISRSALQEYLSGNGNPNVTTLEHLAKKLEIDPSLLICGAFSQGQLTILLKLLDMLKLISGLEVEQRCRFGQLLLEMVSLWDAGDDCE